jgi:hypothetical protein
MRTDAGSNGRFLTSPSVRPARALHRRPGRPTTRRRTLPPTATAPTPGGGAPPLHALDGGPDPYPHLPVRPDDVVYLVDAADRLTGFGGGWDSSALRSGPRLPDHGVLGRPLWDFVSDPGTVEVYRAVLARVRAGRVVTFPLRCDAPSARRVVSVRVSPAGGGRVGFRVRAVREEPRPAVPLLDPAVPRSDARVRMCGWCKRVEVGGWWAEAEDALAVLGLAEQAVVPAVAHGMCADCERRMAALLGGG